MGNTVPVMLTRKGLDRLEAKQLLSNLTVREVYWLRAVADGSYGYKARDQEDGWENIHNLEDKGLVERDKFEPATLLTAVGEAMMKLLPKEKK